MYVKILLLCVQILLPGVRLFSWRSPGLWHQGSHRTSERTCHAEVSWVIQLIHPRSDHESKSVSTPQRSCRSWHMAYNCESWNLTEDVMRKLNYYNSQMLSRITGNDVLMKARSTTYSFDVVKHIRVRRLCWLGQILRGNQDRLIFKVMEAHHVIQRPVNLFLDPPSHVDFQDLVNQSYDKNFWKYTEASIPSHLRGVTIYTE